MDWLLLAALGIMWAAFLIPLTSRRRSTASTVDDFERRMEFLAHAEVNGTTGRWIVTPRKGARFVGDAERRKARVRDRRRRVLVFLIEAIGISLLIGLVGVPWRCRECAGLCPPWPWSRPSARRSGSARAPFG